ncbi:MAG: ATPase, T2SS/T4P/T4SS family [Candidatus Njordarchaeia archaeon]
MSEQESNSDKRFVVDLSLIISGAIRSPKVRELSRQGKFYISGQIIRLLKDWVNKGIEQGIVGINELHRLKEIGTEIEVVFDDGRRDISVEESSMLLAKKINGILLTSDEALEKISETMGLESIFIPPSDHKKLKIKDFFDSETLSVHLKEGVKPMAKKGLPGRWEFVPLREQPLTREELEMLIREIVEEAKRPGIRAFIEIERNSSTIVQLEDLRIVITKPPFSDRIEITAVKPVKKLNIENYNLPERLLIRLKERAEGILISGPPGHGKTTFAQALAEFYKDLGKVVKTVEAPRDMMLSKEITSYSKNFGTPEEIHDILLLSRPDYTIFDEMRNVEDFRLFADLRLAGVGMVGVVHATSPIDAIQRFIGKIELGMIPSIIDTVIFMFEGNVKRVLALKTTVKIPHGLQSEDLARPVVIVYDFISSKPMYEIYTFGERTFVVPVSREAARELYGPEEKEEGFEGKSAPIDISASSIPYAVKMGRKNVIFDFGHRMAGKTVSAYIGNRFLFTDTVSKSGKVKIAKRGKLWRILKGSLEKGDKITFLEEE